MRKANSLGTAEKHHKRLIFFDILRIICVALIVYGHSQFAYIPWLNKILFMDGYFPMNIYPLGLTGISVFGMIFVSGAVIEYNYKKIENVSDYLKFLCKRFIRIYPAFWLSLLFSILLFPWVLQNGLFSTIMEFTGFFVILGQGPGYLNTMGWFIGTIFCLYIIFPLLSKILKEYKIWALLGFLLISYLSRFLLISSNMDSLNFLPRWLPICNLFEFCLGIYIIQNSLFPSFVNTSPFLKKLSDLSFYVFLFHTVVTDLFFLDLQNKGIIYYFFANLGMRNTEIAYTFWYAGLLVTIIGISYIAMIIDDSVHTRIQQNPTIRKFLEKT